MGIYAAYWHPGTSRVWFLFCGIWKGFIPTSFCRRPAGCVCFFALFRLRSLFPLFLHNNENGATQSRTVFIYRLFKWFMR